MVAGVDHGLLRLDLAVEVELHRKRGSEQVTGENIDVQPQCYKI
jgi:hypothetical protein